MFPLSLLMPDSYAAPLAVDASVAAGLTPLNSPFTERTVAVETATAEPGPGSIVELQMNKNVRPLAPL